MTPAHPYDAILLLSFGGPEGPDDVEPFLRNVTRGRTITDERLAAVAEHYHLRGGISPINEQCRSLISALETEMHGRALMLPFYWGNRNWAPLLTDTVAQMADDGITHALALTTSAYSSYSSCRQYHEDVARAIDAVGTRAPVIDKVTQFYALDGFLSANIRAVRAALDTVPAGSALVFTAHSIPRSMAESSRYVAQLEFVASRVAEAVGVAEWDLVFQSRSGPPQMPWLEPDVGDHIDHLAEQAAPGVVVAPIGFISDHMEVIHDLDTEAALRAESAGLPFARAATAGTDPEFVAGLVDLIEQRLLVGHLDNGLTGGVCEATCCPPPLPTTRRA